MTTRPKKKRATAGERIMDNLVRCLSDAIALYGSVSFQQHAPSLYDKCVEAMADAVVDGCEVPITMGHADYVYDLAASRKRRTK